MDTVSADARSRIMSKVKSRGNLSTEIKLIKLLRINRLNGWRRNYKLPGKPDVVYPILKIAIFVDGCFWHGCPKHCRLPKSNTKYWISKIEGNKIRDKIVDKELVKIGWRVIRIWEHEMGDNNLPKKLWIIKQTTKD